MTRADLDEEQCWKDCEFTTEEKGDFDGDGRTDRVVLMRDSRGGGNADHVVEFGTADGWRAVLQERADDAWALTSRTNGVVDLEFAEWDQDARLRYLLVFRWTGTAYESALDHLPRRQLGALCPPSECRRARALRHAPALPLPAADIAVSRWVERGSERGWRRGLPVTPVAATLAPGDVVPLSNEVFDRRGVRWVSLTLDGHNAPLWVDGAALRCVVGSDEADDDSSAEM